MDMVRLEESVEDGRVREDISFEIRNDELGEGYVWYWRGAGFGQQTISGAKWQTAPNKINISPYRHHVFLPFTPFLFTPYFVSGTDFLFLNALDIIMVSVSSGGKGYHGTGTSPSTPTIVSFPAYECLGACSGLWHH